MSTNLFVFLVAIISALALIYLIYLVLLTGNTKTPKKELQISKKDILEQAKILFKQKKYKLVQKLTRKYLEAKPDYIELRALLAKALYSDDSIYDAIKECLSVLIKDDSNNDVRLLLARCYKKINQYAKAINELQEIIKKDPENALAVKDLSEIYLETNQKISAAKILKKLEQLTENNHELLQIKSKLADIQIEMENYPEAFDELNGILEIYPEDIETHKKLIDLYIKIQNYESAINDCEELLKSNESNSVGLWILNNLVNLYYLIKNVDKTMEYAKRLLEHPFSDKLKTRTYIAKILISSGKEDEGMKILSEISEKNKENIDVKRLMINTYVNRKNFVAAIELYKEILDIVNPLEVKNVHTEMSNLFAQWAMYLFDKKELNECFKIFTLAIKYDNANPEVYYQLGEVNILIKNYNEAILQLKKAININSDCAKYHMAIADCYAALGNTFEQKNSLLTAVHVDENDTNALFKLALLHESQHDRTSEIKALEKILEVEPNHLDAKHQLALILESQGNKEEALKLYKEIESVDRTYKNVRENIQMLTKADESQEL